MTDTPEALPPLPDLCSISKPLADFPEPVAYINMKTGQVKSLATLNREKPPGQWWPFNLQEQIWESRAALAQRQQVPFEPLSRSEVDAIFEAHAEAPTMSFRYYVTEAVEKALLKRLAAAPALTAAPSAQAEPVAFKPETWPVDADGDPPHLCTECGTPVRYGSRHSKCAPPTAQAEPVATVSSWVNGSYCRKYMLEWHRDVPVGTVLYAALTAAPSAQAEPQVPLPFNSAQRRRLWDNSPEIHADAKSFAAFERIVRLVESAHGIGKQEGTKA